MNRKMKSSIRVKVLMASLLPLILVVVFVSVFAVYELRKGMSTEALDGLRDLAYSTKGAYNAIDTGEFRLDGNHLMKGEFDVTAHMDVIDSLTEESDSEVTLFYGDTRYASSLIDEATGERTVESQAADVVVETVLNGGSDYSTTNIVINNKSYYGVYIPFKNSRDVVVGMVFAGKPASDINSSINQAILIFAVSAIVFLIIAALCAFFVVNKICAVINRTSGILARIADGDLTVQIDRRLLKRGDETGVMARSLQQLVDQLRGVLGKLHHSSDILTESSEELKDFASSTSSATEEISRAVDDMSKGSISQAEDVEKATLQIGQMGNAIQDIVEKVSTLHEYSQKMEASKNEAGLIVGDLSASSEQTFDAVDRIGKQVKLTDDSVTQIQQAVALITSIAEETNLLSLNASIEAARAGEAGRGFAVVATQIQKLAEESNRSAASIADVIETLSRESKNTVDAMNRMHEIITDQQQKLSDTETKFGELGMGITSSFEQIEEIRDGSQTCDSARAVVTDIIQNLSAVSEENAAATQETTASMQELNSTMAVLAEKSDQLGNLALQLDDELKFFKLENSQTEELQPKDDKK